MFCLISNDRVENPQNSIESMIKNKAKQTHTFPFIKQNLCVTSLTISHKTHLPSFFH